MRSESGAAFRDDLLIAAILMLGIVVAAGLALKNRTGYFIAIAFTVAALRDGISRHRDRLRRHLGRMGVDRDSPLAA